MSDRRLDDDALFEMLSAVVDGEATAPEVARACTAWRDDAKVRAHWSTYQLIGDAMRSDEMANASGSAQFLQSFRSRLNQEPVVLAPAGLTARPQPMVVDIAGPQSAPAPLRRRVWAGPMAVAACFVMVVGALVSSQTGLDGGVVQPVDGFAQGASASSDGLMVTSLASSPWSNQAADTSFKRVGSPPAESGREVLRDAQLALVLAARHGLPQDSSFASRDGLVRTVVFEAP